ncbi:MAG: phosphatidylglycerophosphatase A [Candidatus Eiseniibacteriota bacterium]|nr:MAG: phosphatidylglycerophosphatase A [Candidatus Eisenbacteria bacterium]
MRRAAQILATLFYVGHAPFVPASFGAGAALLIYWFLLPESPVFEPLVAAALVALAVLSSGVAEARYGRDGKQIVIDEVAGMFVSLLLLPRSSVVFLAAFVAFRVLDVLKPFPAGRAQRLPGGWGVVADDIFAGLYTNIFIRLVLLLG